MSKKQNYDPLNDPLITDEEIEKAEAEAIPLTKREAAELTALSIKKERLTQKDINAVLDKRKKKAA
jgi:hypothetical protein